MLVFQAEFLEKHKEFKNGILEFEAKDWHDAVDRASSYRYKCPSDGIKSLKIVGRKILKEEVIPV